MFSISFTSIHLYSRLIESFPITSHEKFGDELIAIKLSQTKIIRWSSLSGYQKTFWTMHWKYRFQLQIGGKKEFWRPLGKNCNSDNKFMKKTSARIFTVKLWALFIIFTVYRLTQIILNGRYWFFIVLESYAGCEWFSRRVSLQGNARMCIKWNKICNVCCTIFENIFYDIH